MLHVTTFSGMTSKSGSKTNLLRASVWDPRCADETPLYEASIRRYLHPDYKTSLEATPSVLAKLKIFDTPLG